MALIHKAESPKTLAAFCQNQSFLKTRIALLTFYNARYSNWSEKLIVVLEYLQLISQALLFHAAIYNYSDSENNFLFRAVVYFFKIVNPSEFLTFDQSDSLTVVILCLILSFTLLKYILFIYLICLAIFNWKAIGVLLTIWRIIFRLQGRILCYFTTSFWLKIILNTTNNTDQSVIGMNDASSIGIGSFLIGLEYLFSLILEMQFAYILPTKNFLSSKNYQLQVGTLLQKFVMQILQISFMSNSEAGAWVFTTFNIILSVIRDYQYYAVLPLYHFNALIFQGDLICAAMALYLACFFQTLLKSIEYPGATINFMIMLWIVITLLMIKASRELLKKKVTRLVTEPLDGPSELIVHKVVATKQLREDEKLPGKNSKGYDITYLLSSTENANLRRIFGANATSEKIVTDINSNKDLYKIFLQYLEDSSLKYPTSSLIKLHIASICTKDSRLYPKIIKIASELRLSKWSTNYLNSSILLYEIEKLISNEEEQGDNVHLDLITYMRSIIFVDDLKKEMTEQIELKMKICNNIIEDTSNIGEIFDSAQIIAKSKARIQKKINTLFRVIPDYYIEPIHLCANYYLVLNYSIRDFQKYTDLFTKKYSKYEKQLEDVSLCNENLFQDSNAFLLLSGQKADLGKIVFATNPILNVCGGEMGLYNSAYFSSLFTPSLQLYYNELFKQIFESGSKSVLNKAIPAYFYNKDKYIVEAEFYLRVHPYITQNLYIDMIIRPIPSKKEYILIKEDGDIEGASKFVSKALGINLSSQSSSSINIKLLSQEFVKINKAFNIIKKVGLPDNFNNTDEKPLSERNYENYPQNLVAPNEYGKAVDIYQTYTSRGRKIELMAIRPGTNKNRNKQTSKRNTYHCNVSILPYNSVFMKLFTLEETSQNHDQDYEDDKDPTIAFDEQENGKDNMSATGSENFECRETDNNHDFNKSRAKKNTHEMTDGNLLSPTNQTQTQTQTHMQVHAFEMKFKKQVFRKNSDSRPSLSNSMVTVEVNKYAAAVGNGEKKKERVYRYLSSTQSSQISQETRTVYKAFRRAITAKSYPRSFNILCVMFYGVILVTLVSQIILKIVTDNTMNDLILKKNMLKYAQLRAYRAVVMQIVCRGTALTISGALTSGDLGSVSSSVHDNVLLLDVYQKDLTNHNLQIIKGIDALDQDIKDKLFISDIKLTGSYRDYKDTRTKLVTHFQVIDEIINSVRVFVGLPEPVSVGGTNTLMFVTLNTLNDFAAKNTEITNMFLNSVQSQREYFQNTITLCLIVTPFLLAGIALTLIIIIWNQYRIEKQHMLAFIKLHPNGVKDILGNLKNLKKILESQEYYDIIQQMGLFENQATFVHDDQLKNYHKKQHTQIVKYSQTRIRYYGYVLKVIFYIAILIGIMMWNYISADQSTSTIYTRQRQLEFANHISSRITINYAAFAELFTSNNTNLVEGVTPLVAMNAAITEIRKIQQQTADKFMEEDKSYDPEIKTMLYTDEGCHRFWGLHLKYCNALAAKGIPINLMPLMVSYETLMVNKLQDYLKADKSSMGKILGAAYINIANILPTFDLIATEAQLMGDIIDANMTKSISEAQNQRTVILIVFSVSLVVVSMLIWSQILTKLREVHNDFRKVLQVFPAKLILSSFLLKTFLGKTSREVHNL